MARQVMLTATAPFTHAGVERQPGDTFKGSGLDALVLRQRRVIAWPPQKCDPEPSRVHAAKSKRRYRRRDLTADDA